VNRFVISASSSFKRRGGQSYAQFWEDLYYKSLLPSLFKGRDNYMGIKFIAEKEHLC